MSSGAVPHRDRLMGVGGFGGFRGFLPDLLARTYARARERERQNKPITPI